MNKPIASKITTPIKKTEEAMSETDPKRNKIETTEALQKCRIIK